ncbi:MAG: Na/Pi cotransporter family protein [Ketobacter sp.]|nr:MAG: Na/Pi cotransporter family protein [Ketobacter sp.]
MSIWMSLLSFVAGLGLFLYGMSQLEEALGVLSSGSFRRFLRRSTGNPVTSVLGGTLTTMLVQSSSMVGLLMMALVGAGIIPLANAVGVVLGANLGTTFTGWIVATLGFKLNLAALALPAMGGGALWCVLLARREHWLAWGRMLFGLGLLLFGLDAMKSSMEQVATRFDVSVLQGYPAIVYLLVGVAFTALIQSSSATMMITLSALHTGIVDLPSAAALVIGADLGTTSTLALGGIKASAVKKQLALAHVLINVVTATLAFLGLPLLLSLVDASGVEDPLYQLVAFHSGFNLVGIVLLLPWVKPFSRFLERRFLSSDDDVRTYIQNVAPTLVQESLEAVAREVECLLVKVMALTLRNLKLEPESLRLTLAMQQRLQQAFPSGQRFEESYDEIKRLEGEILEFCGAVQTGVVAPDQVKQVHRYLNAARHGVYAAKSGKDIRQNLAFLRHSEKHTLTAFYQAQVGLQKQRLTELGTLLEAHYQPAHLRTELGRLQEQVRQSHRDTEQTLFVQGLHDGADEQETSTLLNVNRELKAALDNFALALGCLRLEDAELVD